MTGPAVDQGQQPTYPVGITLEEMERQQAATPAATKPAEIKLDGADVPEEFRGKTLAEVLDFQARTKAALLSSESARREAVERADRIALETGRQPAAVVPTPDAPKKLSRDELRELHKTDPIAAMEYMSTNMATQIVDSFEKRTAGLASSGLTVAEQQARAKYTDEFELFGNDIKTTIAEVVDKSALADPANWDRIISYVRGKPGNFEKLIEKRNGATSVAAAAAARETERVNTGANLGAGRGPAPAARSGKLDTFQQELARGLNMSDEDYIKWGGGR